MTTVTSKNRKMEITFLRTGVEVITKRFRGNNKQVEKISYDVTMVTDYGKEIKTTAVVCYPGESYRMPDGTSTSNKWDLYEYFKP